MKTDVSVRQLTPDEVMSVIGGVSQSTAESDSDFWAWAYSASYENKAGTGTVVDSDWDDGANGPWEAILYWEDGRYYTYITYHDDGGGKK